MNDTDYTPSDESPTWKEDCMHWRGRVLIGRYAHWCMDWDGLPVDETTKEFSCCSCFIRDQLASKEFRTILCRTENDNC